MGEVQVRLVELQMTDLCRPAGVSVVERLAIVGISRAFVAREVVFDRALVKGVCLACQFGGQGLQRCFGLRM